MKDRRQSKQINKGNVPIGGNAPIAVQSMTNTQTDDINKTVMQIKQLENAGCDIIRVAIPDLASAMAISKIKEKINIPLVADIHFNYKLALEAIKQGVDCIRINPGNITDNEKVKEIVLSAKDKNIPIRIGLNSGSQIRTNSPIADDMVNTACKYIEHFEKLNFNNIIISLKASTVTDTIEAYRKMAKLCNYPLHLGVTAAGALRGGTIKAAIGLGTLLQEGIGDTIRVSLSHDPVEEVKAGYEILSALDLRKKPYAEIISCPTCGRCSVDLLEIINKVENNLNKIPADLKLAVMGCMVNGPGEAKDVDYGIAWGNKNCALLFKKGQKPEKIEGKTNEIVEQFIKGIL